MSEHRVRHKSGEYRWILDRGMVVERDADGNALRVIGTHTDITEQYENRQRLIESEDQLEAIFNNSQVGIMFLTGYRILTRANQRMADIVGYDNPEAMLGISMRDLHLNEENFIDFGQRFYDNLRRKKMLHIDYQLRRRDGSAIWCLLSGKALDTAEPPDLGKGVIWVVDDISKRKRAEQALRESGLRFEAVLASTNDGFWLTDLDGRLLEVNEPYCRYSGYRREELLGTQAVELDAHDSPATIQERIERIFRGKSQIFETVHRHKDGSVWPVEISASYSPVQGGRFFLFLRNIEERKQAEQERLRMERELQQTRKMEALGQLTGGVAHEFNNMLAIILGHAGLLRTRLGAGADPHLAGYLDHIDQAGGRARELIGQMLTFSRPQEKRAERLALKPAVQEAITLTRGSLPSSIDLAYSPRAGLPDVNLDAGELQQILTNLLVNARDAMQGKGRIEVGLDWYREGGEECQVCHSQIRGDWVQIRVADNGPGIAAEQLPRIFEPFYTTKTVGKGTGLGLSVVQGILEHSGGHILVDSREGEGTRIRLLFAPLAWEGPRPEPTVETSSNETPLSGRVLLVDDEPALLEFMQELLADDGLEVTACQESREALSLLEGGREFELLITDQTMPGLLGTELAMWAKSRRPGLKVMLCTGYSDRVNAANAESLGIDRYLCKPVDPDELRNSLSDLLG